MLEANSVSLEFGATHALSNVSFKIQRGEFCVVLGRSGAGKSSLLKLFNGLLAPTQGTVVFEEQEISKATITKIRRRTGAVHQQFHLVPRLSVLQNVLTGAIPQVPGWRAFLGQFPMAMKRRACKLISDVGLGEEHLSRLATELSGGQQQRVAIARAFMSEPVAVLADEPVASLDPATGEIIMELIRSVSREIGTTVLCSLHQVELAQAFADRIIGLLNGKVVFDGPPNRLTEQVMVDIYGNASLSGEDFESND